MRRRTQLLLPALSAVVALTLPAHAASTPPQLTDAAGDANFVNGQDTGLADPSQSTSPASVAAADILSVRFATVFKKVGRTSVPNGLTVTMTLGGAPSTGVLYAVSADVPRTCDGQYSSLSLAYTLVGTIPDTYAYCEDPTDTSGSKHTAMLISTTTDAAHHTITWTLDKGMKPGVKVDTITASTSVFVLGVYDDAVGTRTYTYGK